MPRPRGLKLRSDFQRALRDGRACRGEHLELFVVDRGDADPARLGFAAARGVGGAVKRNLMRRRVKELSAVAQVRPGVDVVVRVKAVMEFAQLSEEVRRCLEKTGAAR